ncbi:MAG: hypothetical protein U9Q69_05375 [Nanoarchaeota archaeon]|nr:hypothetical protein [Nanoarchaeota archaeon]
MKNGFKIYNHECYTAFLKEVMNESQLGDKFDEYRKLRNAINYYGKQVKQDKSKELIRRIKELINILKKRI